MSVKKDASGRRSVQVEVEVPGTPEQVWQAIATGPGVSSWFVPTKMDEHKGGTIVLNFGPGMDSVATVTAWDPPHRFSAEGAPGNFGPNSPALGTEWIVEARSGGTCIVRVVHSLFTDSEDWDKELESVESGWPMFFQILRLYLEQFRGQQCSTFQVMGFTPESASTAWEKVTRSLNLSGVTKGDRRSSSAGAPPLAGVVERIGEGKSPNVIVLRVDEPSPGVVYLFAQTMGDQVCVMAAFYLYGDESARAAASNEPLWQAWLSEHFSSEGNASTVT
jgi:uncharacterized protein YndB with AHSA1/START domain